MPPQQCEKLPFCFDFSIFIFFADPSAPGMGMPQNQYPMQQQRPPSNNTDNARRNKWGRM
jgi:hypothetical protein